MTTTEFVTRANTAHVVAADVHWNPDVPADVLRLSARISGDWKYLAPMGARCAYPAGLPEHGPAVCGRGAYAA